MQRRRWLQWGVAGAATLAVFGSGVALWQPAWDEIGLSEAGHDLVAAVSSGFLEGSLPVDTGAREHALQALVTRVEDLVRSLPAHSQEELAQLLSLMAHPAGRVALTGLRPPWAQASMAQVQAALQGMRVSSLVIRRQAYLALHDVIGSAYYADPSTWAELGYPGPQAI